MKIATKQVDKIAIGEDLFHEVVEEHIPRLIQKQTAQLTDFFSRICSYITDHTNQSDWFYISNKDVLYNNAVVALFPDFNNFELGHCTVNHSYDPISFHNEFSEYSGTLMTPNEFRRSFAGKFEKLYEFCPEYLFDGYFTVMDFHKALHADGVRAKRWNGFSKAESYHIPLYRLNGMDSESISPAKTLFFWLENDLMPDDIPADLLATYEHVLSLYKANKDCLVWEGDQIKICEDVIMDSIMNGKADFISDDAYRSSFLYNANEKTISLDNLSDSTLQIVKEHLLTCDQSRADFDRYDENILVDPNRGHWGLWQDEHTANKYTANIKEPMIARNPAADINLNGIIGIDFGTKSTVVAYQDNTERIIPMRIGTSHYSKKADIMQYENPTVMELINLERFMESYRQREGRPDTLWQDLTVSHSAVNSMMNSTSNDYYSFFNELKQWAGNQKKQIRLKDKNGHDISLPPFAEIGEDDFNPIEIYAYYIGLAINNMNNGIFLNYLLSFPVTFEQAICNKIVESFKRGIRKSLPESILHDEEIMKNFRVMKGTSEPAAYAICALEEYGFDLENDEKEVYYGIFDFGGGTTDFDFGHWHTPDASESRRYDYVLECYGSGGDQYLGGENLLQLMAYEVFRSNQDKLREDNITFSLPPECHPFPGSESLISNSQEAKLNTRQLMEKLRPFWERDENYASLYQTGKIKLSLVTRSGEQKLNYELDVNMAILDKLLHKRIELGIANFFECLKATFKDKLGTDIHCVHIFLAGNGSRSQILTDLFETYMITYADDLQRHVNSSIGNDFFRLHPALGMADPSKGIAPTTKVLSGIEAAKQSTNGSIADIANAAAKHSSSAINNLAQQANSISGLTQSVSDIEDLAQSIQQAASSEEDIRSITKPNGKTGVAFGLLEGRPGGRIKIILPLSQDVANDSSDILFRFYVGYKKKNLFQMISDPSLPYNKWTYLCDASTEDFAIYYTPRSEAASGTLSIFDVYKKNCRLSKAYENASIYYRAVAPDTLEYTVISNDNFDSAKLLENVVRVELSY